MLTENGSGNRRTCLRHCRRKIRIGGAAVGGAILGAIFGGGRGAAIGGSIGAAGGTAAALNNGEAEPAGLPPGTRLTVRLSRPVAVAGRAMTARRYRWNER